MICMELKNNYPYMTKKQLMEEFRMSRSFVDKKVKGIEKEIKAGRYNRYAMLDGAVNVCAFIDYWKYEKQLADPNMRRHVPEFAPDEIMDLCGYKQKRVNI